MSPLFFNLVVDILTRMLIKAAREEHISGFMNSVHPEGILSRQYANDILLFLRHNYVDAAYLKWVMIYFEQISGMKINYNKSDMVPINLDEGETLEYSKIFCCKVGAFRFKYLGAPLHHEKLRKEDIQPVVDKVINRIPGWKGRLLSYGDRLVLLKACLPSIPIYLMSLIKFPKWTIEAINS
jgi:hypothetical protein